MVPHVGTMSDTEQERECRLLPTHLDGYTFGHDYSSRIHDDLAEEAALPPDNDYRLSTGLVFLKAQRALGRRLRAKKHWRARHRDPRISPARSQDMGSFYFEHPRVETSGVESLTWDTCSSIH